MDVSAYKPLFYPESLAVVGASESPLKFGGMFMRAILSYGFKGKVFPVNPKGGTIMGLKAFRSVSELPGPADLAVITVPARQAVKAVKECAKKGIKAAEILSAGFREAGPEGAALEEELSRVAKKTGLRIVGPNCFGVYSPAAGLTLMPGAEFPKTPGSVGFISQSGGGACDLVYMAMGRGVRFSVVISYGNGCDLSAGEMLRYFEADERTRLVGVYLEGVDQARDFYDALKSCAAKKPVVILKGGLTKQGPRGTLGHTGSLAGSRVAWEAAIRGANAVMARDLRDLAELLMAFNCLGEFKAEAAGILAGGGLRTVDGLDAASVHGFKVPELDPETAGKIQALLPPAGGRGANPVDLANPVMSPAVINPVMELLAARPDIHFLVIYQMLFYLLNSAREVRLATGNQDFKLEYHTSIAAKAVEIREKTGKPLIMILLDIASHPRHFEMEAGRWEAREHYTARGIPVFDTGLQAFSVLRRVADYYRRREGAKSRAGS